MEISPPASQSARPVIRSYFYSGPPGCQRVKMKRRRVVIIKSRRQPDTPRSLPALTTTHSPPVSLTFVGGNIGKTLRLQLCNTFNICTFSCVNSISSTSIKTRRPHMFLSTLELQAKEIVPTYTTLHVFQLTSSSVCISTVASSQVLMNCKCEYLLSPRSFSLFSKAEYKFYASHSFTFKQ